MLGSLSGEVPTWEASVRRLRSSGGELRGELTVRLDGRHLSAGTFNLSSLSARASTARLLAARAPRVSWADILERLCVGVLASEAAGEAVQVIGSRRPQAQERRLLGSLLPIGHVTVLFGPGGTGKSTLAAAITTSVSTGSRVIPGWLPSGPAPVVILDYESNGDDWSNLVASVAEGAGIDPPSVAYLRMRRPLADDIERIAELVAGLGAALVVVDSVGLALGIGRDAGDPADGVLRLFAALRLLGTTVLLVDHVTGADIGQGVTGASKPYGSVYKVNAARAVWELRRELEPRDGVAEVMLINTKANLGPKQPSVGLRMIYGDQTIRFERAEVSAPELTERLPIHQRMQKLLMGGAMRTSEVASELRVPESSIRTMVSRHSDSFTRLPDGRVGIRA